MVYLPSFYLHSLLSFLVSRFLLLYSLLPAARSSVSSLFLFPFPPPPMFPFSLRSPRFVAGCTTDPYHLCYVLLFIVKSTWKFRILSSRILQSPSSTIEKTPMSTRRVSRSSNATKTQWRTLLITCVFLVKPSWPSVACLSSDLQIGQGGSEKGAG